MKKIFRVIYLKHVKMAEEQGWEHMAWLMQLQDYSLGTMMTKQ
jgi:hypothetical protein